MINDSKESTILHLVEFYVVKNGIMKKNLELNETLNLKVCEVIDKYKVECDEVEIDIEVDGKVLNSGSITFNRGKTTSVEHIYGDQKVVTNSNV